MAVQLPTSTRGSEDPQNNIDSLTTQFDLALSSTPASQNHSRMCPAFSNELWIEIINYLPHSDQIKCSLVSKQLNAVSKPGIYSIVDTTSCVPYNPLRSLRCLFRTMIEDPTLAKYVKHAKFSAKYFARDSRPTAASATIPLEFLTAENEAWIREQLANIVTDELLVHE